MKKAIKQLLRIGFVIIGSSLMVTEVQYSFFWWAGFIGAVMNGVLLFRALNKWLDN